MMAEIQVNPIPPDVAASVFHATVSVSRNIHNRTERKNGSVCGNRSFSRAKAAGRISHRLSIPFVRARRNHGTEQPVAFPSATFAAGTIARSFQNIRAARRLPRWADRRPPKITNDTTGVADQYGQQKTALQIYPGMDPKFCHPNLMCRFLYVSQLDRYSIKNLFSEESRTRHE